MATKRKKGRGEPRKPNHKAFLIVFAFFLGSMTILGVLLNRSISTRTSSPQIYEDLYGVNRDLSDEIIRIDNAIYQSLYQREVSEKRVFFLRVEPKYERGYAWDFAEMLIKVSKRDAMTPLYELIKQALAQMEPAVRHKTEHVSGSEILLHVFVGGSYTHKIRLAREKDRKDSSEDLPKVAIVIDDLGYDFDMVNRFIELDLPLSLSVLPVAPYTRSIVDEANKRGYELILHLPMEPKDYPHLNPGPMPLLTNMTETEIRSTIDYHLNQISGVQGVNNHMGSSFTERPDKMSIFLGELKKRNLFFLDSRTTSLTVAFDLAKKMGVPVARRSVFLDNDLSMKAIRFQMERLLGTARHSGAAIGIGHPNKETLEVLGDYIGELKSEFEVVSVSKLVN